MVEPFHVLEVSGFVYHLIFLSSLEHDLCLLLNDHVCERLKSLASYSGTLSCSQSACPRFII
ncbi:unnamed protein product [Brassica oleracea]